MKRIRMSGSDHFDSVNIFCDRCNKPIILAYSIRIIDGDPQTPIYYKHDVFHYCSNCGNDWSYTDKKFHNIV